MICEKLLDDTYEIYLGYHWDLCYISGTSLGTSLGYGEHPWDTGNIPGNISGNISGITGNISGITGNISGITGNISEITGNISEITGNISEIYLGHQIISGQGANH